MSDNTKDQFEGWKFIPLPNAAYIPPKDTSAPRSDSTKKRKKIDALDYKGRDGLPGNPWPSEVLPDELWLKPENQSDTDLTH
jgi:hypothetical protein